MAYSFCKGIIMGDSKDITDYTPQEKELLRAKFHNLVKLYLFLYVLIILFGSVVLIIVIPFWILGLGIWWSSRYFRRLECILRERTLYFRRGVLIRSESTIPLDRITDLTIKEGPLLRLLGLSRIRVETPGTSGQSGAGGITMVGIIDTPYFRSRVLAQRDLITMQKYGSSNNEEAFTELIAIAREIRDSVKRIESAD